MNHIEEDIESQQGLLSRSEKPVNPSLRTLSFFSFLSKLVLCFRPSAERSTFAVPQQRQLPYTAALDGLRGLAAFIVLNYHWFLYFYDMNVGYIPNSEHARLFNLPFLKFLSNGLASVAIFFIISGYALSYKCLKLAQTQSWEKVHYALCSSVFRRFLRLYIPCYVCLLVLAVLFGLGINEPGRPHIADGFLGSQFYPPTYESLWQALHVFCVVAVRLANPWTWGEYRPMELESNLWTIPIEFRTSMVLFIFLLGSVRVKRPIRLALTTFVIAWTIYGERNEVVLFLVGSVLADIDINADHHQYPRFGSVGNKLRHNLSWGLLLLFGVYLCSSPNTVADQSTGYHYITRISASLYFWPNWLPWIVGGSVLVYSATKASHFNNFLTSNVIQYLGRISFSLYIVHGSITRLIAYNVVPLLWSVFGSSPTGYFICVLIGYFVAVAIAIPVAGFFTTWIDSPSIKFGKWVESKCFI
jgi:peptidoglycan/LPS O-acetylase OafA/YrhL